MFSIGKWVLGLGLLAGMIVGARIEIPLGPIPFILSDFFVLLAGLLLGRRGIIVTLLYLALGAVGLPVFAGGTGGIARFGGPTGGYLIGYALATIWLGWGGERIQRSWPRLLGLTASGQGWIFLPGLIGLYLLTDLNWSETVQSGLLDFAFPIALKMLLSTTIAYFYYRYPIGSK